ncbi:EamA family transporter RarD [Anaeroselena agilis]|uniref:EamA family transporter RarD n=1 Tax=Anaeroselena agilis TaxID=3063788 RepID=A0ABU3P012_9FIRM|nr:EamA family transporter RarD [Selenomonadales bacterium 4137-cl]
MTNRPKIDAGLASAVGCYILWGFLPIYWKFLSHVPALEILAHRIVWSFVFLIGLLAVTGKISPARREIAAILADRKKLAGVLAATVLISINWLVYIWAVNDSRILETSLGYYINPLVSVLLGIVVLKERLSLRQTVAVALAGLGVLNQAVNVGGLPWVSLALAFSFGLYGLCKKMLHIGAVTGITLETLLLSPISFLYLAWLQNQGVGALTPGQPATAVLLILTGAVTAIPLLLFANAANRIPLTILGFIQYLSPTIALFVGVFIYHEPFSAGRFLSFAFIWAALAVFSLPPAKRPARREPPLTEARETAK